VVAEVIIVGAGLIDVWLLMDEPRRSLAGAAGALRTYTLVHGGSPVLLNLGDPSDIDISACPHRGERVDARYYGGWELPVVGEVSAPTAVLIRPDGYVAGAGQSTATGLSEELSFWFGSSTVVE
ncbi:MAG: hypothetical protein L0J13_14915, partial [Brevibacterium sp.]|nr:hypothetical protein [Brevibacterium sp.]